jgi:hypothetical protein
VIAIGSAVATGILAGLAAPEALAFRIARSDVGGIQARLLRGLVGRNAETVFGRRHDFATIRSVVDYQVRAPLSTYDDYRDAIRRIGDGEPHVLTREPVRLLEPTSGSTDGVKLIPYTASLRAGFERAVAVWLWDLYRHHPALLGGPAYWSATPVARRQAKSPGGLPIGFEEDSEYLGPLRGGLIRRTFAVPPAVRLIADMEAFRYTTLRFLVQAPALSLVSVWHPSFLTLLLSRLPGWGDRLASDVARGRLTPPAPLAPALASALAPTLHADERRAAEIREACRGRPPADIHQRLWPRLRLVSCWADAWAALHVPELARLLPQARIQGKGLMATEGVVSFPLVGREGGALAIRSHFYEFLPADGGPVRLAHELTRGGRYAVVLTTGGGLYRYRLQDLVEVTGQVGACPLLRFVGREAPVADRFGEKLHEGQVGGALEALLRRHAIVASFAMVAYEGNDRPRYVLFVEAPGCPDEPLGRLGDGLEGALGESYHYRYCRDLGQLAPLEVFRIEGGATERYLAHCRARGQRIGDVKPRALSPESGWTRVFRGRFLSQLAREGRDAAQELGVNTRFPAG